MERPPTPIPSTSTLPEEHELMVCEPAVPWFWVNRLARRIIQCGEPSGPQAEEDLRLARSERSAHRYRIDRILQIP